MSTKTSTGILLCAAIVLSLGIGLGSPRAESRAGDEAKGASDDSSERFAVTRTNSLREGPGGRFVSVGLLSRGTRVVSRNENRKGWLKVELNDGRVGWVNRRYLRELGPREGLERGNGPRAAAFHRSRRRPGVQGGFLFPLPGGKVNSLFGDRIDPISKRRAFHNGIDIAAPVGSPVRSCRSGVVSFAGRNRGYGKLVIVDHGLGYKTYYAHLRWITVRKGSRVSVGQMVGRVGETGRTTGPHLHFEVRKNGKPINPLLQRLYSGRSYP